MRVFSSFHPAALFTYYIAVLLTSMFTRNPVIIALSLLGSFFFFASMSRPKEILKSAGFYLVLFLLMTLANPLFSHDGETILFLVNDNPFTLEALLYGALVASMLIAVLFWCKCYYLIMTSDKFIYLFGKAAPKLSLVLSMALRFIPDMKAQSKRIRAAQKTLGLYLSKKLVDRLLSELRVFSALLSWSLENAVETSDSMRARGYGLKNRSHFSLFTFRLKDGVLIILTLLVFAATLIGMQAGLFTYEFYPALTPVAANTGAVVLYSCLAIFMLAPFLLELEEHLHWNYLKSKV
ncbi:MAG: energy-coupling factor transporter transmembrane component T [Christensenellales bacterium]|jgi:energy-coupling factor transport system permease protein